MNVEYRTLEGVPNEQIHTAFERAFSDYQVPQVLPLWKFEGMLQRRGFVPQVSLGAFYEQSLVGFILNGLRPYQGILTAYDVGTGVVPHMRQQGISGEMFRRALALLQAQSAGRYLLEVLTHNEAALRLYRKQGFETCREFSCYRIAREALVQAPAASNAARLAVEALPWSDQAADYTGWWEYAPSWQNSLDSVRASGKALTCFLAVAAGQALGYGILDPRSGDVAQLAVRPAHRRQGTGRRLLQAMGRAAQSETLSVLNVDARAPSAHAFLDALGFENFVGQYEMVLPL
jgi:ribosomal protein S18 acetylase RimI-like enzyme